MTDRMQYLTKLENELAARRTEADRLRATVREADTDRTAEYERLLDALKTKEELVESRLANIRERKDEAWDGLKDGADRAWDELNDALLAAKRGIQSKR